MLLKLVLLLIQARLTRRRRCGSRFVWFCCRCGIAVTHVDPYVVLCRAPVSRGDRAYCDCTACGVLCVCGLVVVLVLCRAPVLSSLCVGERDERGSGGRAPRPEWLRAERHEAERCSERSDLRRGTQAKAQAPRRGRAPGTAARAAAAAYLRNKGRPSRWTSVHISSLSRWRGRSGRLRRGAADLYYGRRD